MYPHGPWITLNGNQEVGNQEVGNQSFRDQTDFPTSKKNFPTLNFPSFQFFQLTTINSNSLCESIEATMK